ncbi:MAG: hypothetical protein AB7F36_10695 [Reyranellaceae bacterium]
MMSSRELALGMVGVWRLARNDGAGVQYFERSLDAARRSFWVMLLLVPADAIQSMMQIEDLGLRFGGARQLILLALFYVVGWLYFPVVVLRVAEATGRLRGFPGYLAAFNYAQILLYALVLGLNALTRQMPSAVQPLIGLTLLVLIALVHFRLLRHMMELPIPQAGMLVFANLCLNIALGLTMQYLLLLASQPAA